VSRNSEVKRNSATLDFEETLWQAADKMRGTYHAWREERGLAQAERSEDVPVSIVDVSIAMSSCRDATSTLSRSKRRQWLDTLSDTCYYSSSIPTGPLPQGMLSLGGFFTSFGGLT